MDESEETRCQLIKPGSNSPIFLQLIEEAFYYVPLLVPEKVAVPRINGIGLWWNAKISIPIGDILPEFIGTICLVGQYSSFIWFQFYMIHNVFCNDRIVDIP